MRILVLVFIAQQISAQNVVNFKFGKGLQLVAKDSSIYLKFSTRIQTRFDTEHYIEGDHDPKHKFFVRRARLKFDGFAFRPHVVYKIEFDMVKGQMLDAVIKWGFVKNMQLWFGQTKLPGNRERLISSQKLQFVDRSMLNSKFTLDRDAGIQIRREDEFGKFILRLQGAVSTGEGLNYGSFHRGMSYTGKIEILPFGKFSKKGEYVGSALKRERKAKLALAAAFNFNDEAMRHRSHTGDELSTTRDISTLFADLMFKYRGWSLMYEFAQRTATGGPVVDSTSTIFTGQAINWQTGILTKKNWEIAYRYTVLLPETASSYNQTQEFVLAISKYIVNHSLKVQADIGYRDEDTKDGRVIGRFQTELSF